MIIYDKHIISLTNGLPIPFASVLVKIANTNTDAVLYSNPEGSAQVFNPATADSTGRVIFYIAPGTYDITVSRSDITAVAYNDVFIAETNEDTDFKFLPHGGVISQPSAGSLKFVSTDSLKSELNLNNAANNKELKITRDQNGVSFSAGQALISFDNAGDAQMPGGLTIGGPSEINSGGGARVSFSSVTTGLGELAATIPEIVFDNPSRDSDSGDWDGNFKISADNNGMFISYFGGTSGPLAGPSGLGIGADGRKNDIFIAKDGKVGIGTLTPQSKLEVVGGARLDEIRFPSGDIIKETSGHMTLKSGDGSTRLLFISQAEAPTGAIISGPGIYDNISILNDTGSAYIQIPHNSEDNPVRVVCDGGLEASSKIFSGDGVFLYGGTYEGDGSGLENISISQINNLQNNLNLKANVDSQVFTGAITLPANTAIGTVSPTEISYIDGLTSNAQAQINLKASSSLIGAANGIAPLGSDSKIPSAYLPVSGSHKGTWNSNTNMPTITSGTGTNGDFYFVSVASSGVTTIDGISTWGLNDQLRFNGSVWQKIPDSSGAVSSVAGKTGTVTLVPSDAGVNIGSNVQAYSAALDTISALATNGILRRSLGVWGIDTASYLTANQTITLSGVLSGSGSTSINASYADGQMTNSKLANVASFTIKGRISGSPGAPEDLTATQARTILGIEAGATANSPDAYLLSRGNHTGTQSSATITGLAPVATTGSAADLSGVLDDARIPASLTGKTFTGDVNINSSQPDLILRDTDGSASTSTGGVSLQDSVGAAIFSLLAAGDNTVTLSAPNRQLKLTSAVTMLLQSNAITLTVNEVYLNGNVAINNTATAPIGALDVYAKTSGNATILNLISQSGGSGNTGLYFRPYQTAAQAASNPAAAAIVAEDSNFSADIVFKTKNPGALSNALVDRMVLEAGSGNLFLVTGTYNGNGSGLTDIDSTAIVGVIPDSSISNNVAFKTWVTSNFLGIGGTAANSTLLNGNAANFYTNSSNQSAGTLPDARLSAAIARSVDVVQKARPVQLEQDLGSVSGLVVINPSNGTHIILTIAGATSIQLPGALTGEAQTVTMEITNGGAHSVTFTGTVRWPGGNQPPLTVSGTDVLTFLRSGSALWRGGLSWGDSK